MAGQPVPIPAPKKEDGSDEKILCIEDLRQSAVRKLPHGIQGKKCIK